jgi:hypothetical protein
MGPLHIIPPLGLDDFINCTTHRDIADVHEAYRRYLWDKWAADAEAILSARCRINSNE